VAPIPLAATQPAENGAPAADALAVTAVDSELACSAADQPDAAAEAAPAATLPDEGPPGQTPPPTEASVCVPASDSAAGEAKGGGRIVKGVPDQPSEPSPATTEDASTLDDIASARVPSSDDESTPAAKSRGREDADSHAKKGHPSPASTDGNEPTPASKGHSSESGNTITGSVGSTMERASGSAKSHSS